MTSEEQLEVIINRCNELLANAMTDGNEQKVKLYSAIGKILLSDKPFEHIDLETSISLLNDLQFPAEAMPKILKNLIKNHQ